MKNNIFRIAFIIFMTLILVTTSAIGKDQNPQKPKKSKEPLEITSDRMRSENGGIKIIFSGNVESYKGDLKITSDIMEVYNSDDTKETDEVVALGNVFITRGLKKAKHESSMVT